MTSAFTASVWGQGRAAIALSAQVAHKIKEGDEECHICRDDIPATIAFVPCKHKVCFGCVENMRAKNIFKADKGIKCPFCRQYVDGYRSTLAPDPDVQAFLVEANKAAGIAAQARAIAERKAMGGAAPPAQSSSTAAAPATAGRQAAAPSEDQQWNCGSCGEKNYVWREFCGRCKRPCPNPYASDKVSQTRKDLALVTREELVGYLRDQGGFSLRRGLRDMGISLDSSKTYGSVACIREAVATNGLKRRVLHMAGLLCDPDALRDASLSHLGNLGVQRMLESMAKLRLAFPPARPNADLEAFKHAHNGKDPFAALLEAMCCRMLEFCLHEKGVYVVQCAAGLCSNEELVMLANVVFPLALPVSRDPRGVFVLLHLLDLTSQRIWDDAENCEPALQAVDLLCKIFTASEKQLVFTAHHALSGKVLVRAIAVSMPRAPAQRMAVKIAAHASTLAGSPGGMITLMEVLQLFGHNQQAMEGLRDVVTTMCYSLQGQLGRLACSSDESSHELLLCLVERLGHEQEIGWLESVAQELVGVVEQLITNPTGLEVLKFTLTQPCLDLDAVTAHISDMKTALGKALLLPLVADIMERLASNPPPPPPKYAAASVVQPELRYLLQQGHPTPLPPPPPPRPGEPGYEAYAAEAAVRAEAQAAAAAAARAAREAEAAARREAAAAMEAAERAERIKQRAADEAAANEPLDAWGSIKAAGFSSGANAWASSTTPAPAPAPAPAAASSNSRPADGWGAVAAQSDNAAADCAWGSVLRAPQGGASGWDVPQPQQPQPQPQPQPLPSGGVPIAIPVAVPVATPVAVPVATPVSVPVATPAPMAVPRPPIAPRLAEAAAHSAWPMPAQAQQQQSHGFGSTGALNSGGSSQRQQQQQRPASAPQPQQQQQQQAHGPWSCQICTYEHAGPEAEFLFCAMCTTQRPD